MNAQKSQSFYALVLAVCSILFLSSVSSLYASTENKEIRKAIREAYRQEYGYDIYLLIGQSNMAGRGTMIATDTIDYVPGVYLLNQQGLPESAKAPLNRYSTIRKALPSQQIGLGYSFAEQMHHYSGRKILLVVNARGGSSIQSWAPDDKEHGYLSEAIKRTREALPYGRLKGILWHQGETDVQKNTSDYVERFIAMMQHLRRELNAPNVPIAVGELGQWEWDRMNKIEVFNDSILPTICHSLSLCVKVHSDDLKRLYKDKPSDPHFSRESQIDLGKRYADALLPHLTDIYVAPYYQGKRAAISFTFDDGDREHATLVAPELEKRGFRGTFWIMASVIGKTDVTHPRLTWDQIREMTARGHEVSNHSWSHAKLIKLNEQEVLAEILRNDSAIEQETGVRPITFCYPYNSHNDVVRRLASAGRVGTRLRQVGHGQQNNKTTPEKLSHWLHRTLESGDWGVTMTHGINEGYDKWYRPQQLWDFFDEVKGKEDSIWVGTFRDVAAYRAERENLMLRIERGRRSITIVPRLMLDQKLFRHPLTMIIRGDWSGKNIIVSQQDATLQPRVAGDKLMFDFDPSAGRIRIEWKR